MNATAPDKLAYNVPEAASAIGISRANMFERISKGEIPSVKVAGRRLILREDLEAYLKAHRRQERA